MNRPRTSPTLPDLIAGQPPGSPWRWSAADPEPSGRLLLPTDARQVLGATSGHAQPVSGIVQGDALVLRAGPGHGRVITVDARGRIYLPAWLRSRLSFVIGSRTTPEPVVLVVPATVLDAVGDEIVDRSE